MELCYFHFMLGGIWGYLLLYEIVDYGDRRRCK